MAVLGVCVRAACRCVFVLITVLDPKALSFPPEMHAIHLFLPLYLLGRNNIFLTNGLKVICMILAQSCSAQTGMAQVGTLCEAHLFDVPEPRNPLYFFEGLRRHLGFN